jgi:hypothetical protein
LFFQYNDVAILTLDSPVQFSAAIAPVCLPPKGSNEQFVSKESTVVGWGALKEGIINLYFECNQNNFLRVFVYVSVKSLHNNMC